MSVKTDPFTRTPGIAGKAYIDCGIADEIINNFCNAESSKYVYKITGLRGSGKSVEYSKVVRGIMERDDWCVYTLSANGEAVKTLLSRISAEPFLDSKKKSTRINSVTKIGANALFVSGDETVSLERIEAEDERYYSEEAALFKMVKHANQKGYNILVGIDDISKTAEMVRLLSMVGAMQLEGLQLYLLVTGLSENIEEFSSEKNLTFFKRADSKEIKGLNKYDICYMYEKLLGVESEEARRMVVLTQGYAYAYQVLGSLYFGKKKSDDLDELLPEYERILYKDCYDMIWNSLTDSEKELVRCIYRSGNGRAESIKKLMQKPESYPVYRNRLINKHLVDGDTRGYLKMRLPLFDKFIEMWGV